MRKKNHNTRIRASSSATDWDAGLAAPMTAAVPLTLGGMRLDQALVRIFPQYSRNRLQAWLKSGHITIDGRRLDANHAVTGGEAVALQPPRAADAAAPQAQRMPLKVVFEDAALIVIDKPAGLVVHPGAGQPDRTLLNALLAHAPALAAVPRGGIVHRLDKDTSGLMVVARTVEAHTALVRAIEAREVEREYEAVCVGVMTGGGVVDAPIDRHPVDRLKMAVRENGREAVTHYRVLHRYRGHTHVRVKLESGRTHQIRVHMMHIHYPLVGDRVYGGRMLLPKGAAPELIEAIRGFKRQALHAARLVFEHPVSGKPIENEAPLPDDFKALLAVLARDATTAKK
jgi:23S rRNA pseudouridine1911/1915/1917 synthase